MAEARTTFSVFSVGLPVQLPTLPSRAGRAPRHICLRSVFSSAMAARSPKGRSGGPSTFALVHALPPFRFFISKSCWFFSAQPRSCLLLCLPTPTPLPLCSAQVLLLVPEHEMFLLKPLILLLSLERSLYRGLSSGPKHTRIHRAPLFRCYW